MAETSQTPTCEPSPDPAPLCVDLDGTLIKSDALHEALLLLARTRPVDLLRLPFWLPGGKARFKQRVANRVDIDPKSLPYNETLLSLLKGEKASGRDLFLATAADERIARAISVYLGIFSGVIASDGRINKSGKNKLEALESRFGAGNFDYAGNGRVDLAIWAQARTAWLVNPDRGVEARLKRIARIEQSVETRATNAGLLRKLLRTYQGPIYLLALLPLAAAHYWGFLSWTQAALGFIAFCFCGSGASLINDMLNLTADRSHPTRQHRPLASGDLSLKWAVLLTAAALLGGFGIASFLPSAFWISLVVMFVIMLTPLAREKMARTGLKILS